jgi:hypothetical protein
MKIKDIIEKLCNHEISKFEAINQIKNITDGLRKNDSLEFIVESFAFTVGDNHGILNLTIPYGYSKIEGKIKRGDKIDVLLLP